MRLGRNSVRTRRDRNALESVPGLSLFPVFPFCYCNSLKGFWHSYQDSPELIHYFSSIVSEIPIPYHWYQSSRSEGALYGLYPRTNGESDGERREERH